MAKSNGLANALLDAVFNGGSAGTVTIGALTLTLPFRCKFLQSLPTPTVAGTEFPATGGYTAGGPSIAGTFATPAAGGSKTSTSAITVSNAPAGIWAGNEITDAGGTRLNYGPSTSLNKTVNLGDTCTIPNGALSGSEQ